MERLLSLAQKTVDLVADHWTVAHPATDQLRRLKIVGHRGIGSGPGENQIAGFVACAEAGVWGVELDVRWTRDNVPIVLHDANTRRVFAAPVCHPQQLTWIELQCCQPGVPSLQQVLSALRGRCHLMIEIKEEFTPEREEILSHILSLLRPKEHYHLLTLEPALLENCQKFKADCRVLVSELNAAQASRYVLRNAWGGTAGHYLLQTTKQIAAHHHAGQAVGAGFITSFNNVCRQLHRQIDWIFSDQAVNLQQAIRRHLDQT
ncbi:MAG: glycerophosphodiester phosphodiesterase [Bdellovibrionales bacterium]